MIIEEFKSQTELNECLLWWQARLQLTDWIITARKVSKHELDNPDDQGECLMIHSRKVAEILILNREDLPQDSVVNTALRYCEEEVLVHELLHLIYNWMQPPTTYEAIYLDEMEHQLLDTMARSLIMVKYNLDLSYFKKPIESIPTEDKMQMKKRALDVLRGMTDEGLDGQ